LQNGTSANLKWIHATFFTHFMMQLPDRLRHHTSEMRHQLLPDPEFSLRQCQAKLLWLTSHKISKAATKSTRLRERLTALNITDLPRSDRVTSASPAPLPQESKASGPSIDKLWNGRITSTKRRIPRTASVRAAIANQLANFIVGL
jgi:hypothetical protein